MAGDNEELDSEYDVIIIGTGLVESIVSAAVSRVGHTVLHIDPRDYYGGKWGTLSWDNWISGTFAKTPSRIASSVKDNNIEWTNDVRELEQVWYLEKISGDNDEEVLAQEKILSLTRGFNIDIFPKVLMAREKLIKLLIHSNVSRYLEFKCITKLFSTLLPPNEHTIEPIPLSRSDIFTTKTISLIEKRSLMKFIESIMKMADTATDGSASTATIPDENESLKPKTFEELSKHCNMSKKVQHLLKSAVRTMDDCYFEINSDDNEKDTSLRASSIFNQEFAIHCKQFLQSIGHYGNQTPFLWTLYGISEICQAFCRMSAIYGGIFILKRSIESIHISNKEDGHNVQILSEGKELKSKYLVLGPEVNLKSYWDEETSSPKSRQGISLARAVLLTMGPKLQTSSQTAAPAAGGDEDPTNLSIHRINDMDIIELDETSLAVPKNYRLLQVTCPYLPSQAESPRVLIESRLSPFINFCYTPEPKPSETLPVDAAVRDEEEVLEQPEIDAQQFLPPTTPVVIYGSYFLLNFSDDLQVQNENSNANIFCCAVSSTEITEHVDKAKSVFFKMFPTEDFLPKAPDPAEAHDDNEIFPGEDEGILNHHAVGNGDALELDEDVIPNVMENGLNGVANGLENVVGENEAQE